MCWVTTACHVIWFVCKSIDKSKMNPQSTNYHHPVQTFMKSSKCVWMSGLWTQRIAVKSREFRKCVRMRHSWFVDYYEFFVKALWRNYLVFWLSECRGNLFIWTSFFLHHYILTSNKQYQGHECSSNLCQHSSLLTFIGSPL
jgi:hypothetical protein